MKIKRQYEPEVWEQDYNPTDDVPEGLNETLNETLKKLYRQIQRDGHIKTETRG